MVCEVVLLSRTKVGNNTVGVANTVAGRATGLLHVHLVSCITINHVHEPSPRYILQLHSVRLDLPRGQSRPTCLSMRLYPPLEDIQEFVS